MAWQAPAPLPHLGLLFDAELNSTDFPGPLPHIGKLLGTVRVLTAEYGAYTIAGQDATVTSSVEPGPGPLPHIALLGGLGSSAGVSDYGTYSLSGQDASLKYGRSLAADVGYIGIYGQVGLLAKTANSSGESAPFPSMGTLFVQTYSNRTLTCDTGVYAYTGSDGLSDLELNGDTETYSIAGQNANLAMGRVLTAEHGSYSIAGQDSGAIRSGAALSFTAEHGTYTITGSDAGVRAAHVVSAEFGFYAALGQLAILSVGVDPNTNLNAEYGTYELTGFGAGPEISAASVVATGAPGRGRARRERYLAIINGKKHWGTREEIERLIESLAETQAEKPKKKRAKIVVKPAEPVSTATPEEKVEAAQVQTDVRQMYEELYRKAVAELELQEEEDLIGLL